MKYEWLLLFFRSRIRRKSTFKNTSRKEIVCGPGHMHAHNTSHCKVVWSRSVAASYVSVEAAKATQANRFILLKKFDFVVMIWYNAKGQLIRSVRISNDSRRYNLIWQGLNQNSEILRIWDKELFFWLRLSFITEVFTTSQDFPQYTFPKNGFKNDDTENGSW